MTFDQVRSKHMRVAVFGTGGVGGYFGARLVQAGEEVIFIARGEHLKAMRADGLRIESQKGDYTVSPTYAEADPAKVGVVDVVLVGVKAWQVPEAAAAMRPMVGEKTIVIPLQNGVDAPGQLAAVLDTPGAEPHVLGGLCQISALIAAPGVIKHAAIEPLIAFNELDGVERGRTAALHAAFARVGVNAQVPADIRVAMWNKFAFIAPFSGVGAVARASAGAIRSIPETRSLLEQAIGEVAAVGRAKGVQLAEDTTARTLAFIDSLPVAGMASMTRDIIAGRPSELETQNGAVVRMGKECNIPTSAHAFIYASLLPQEVNARAA
jgi:2-dehydropantoate 2-reductase